MRMQFYFISIFASLLVASITPVWPAAPWLLVVIVPYILTGLFDIFFSRSNVLKNYPVIGHLRYMLEFISPEIHQYFIEGPHDGRPFNREQRNIVYSRAQGKSSTMPFGTQYEPLENGLEFAHHSLEPVTVSEAAFRIRVGGAQCTRPYMASRINISAMSFGALSMNAIRALNRGARLGGFFHNTGEGGLSPYHLEQGGDICWQIGTGYFGCRHRDGSFDPDSFRDKALDERVKLIELKLSQGAKPSHGGILPGVKVTREIADIRMVNVGEDCISPPAHSAFQGPSGLLRFIQQLRELADGKPVGFKLCIGRGDEFMGIVKAMQATGIRPDFITVDGAEGGTGAAPFEFSDSLGLPLNEGLRFVHNVLVGAGLRDDIRLIASGKVTTGFDVLVKLALGADMVNMARPMMFALGCIQARRCNTNTCPSGVTTQDPARGRAIDVELRGEHVRNFHAQTLQSFAELLGALGHRDPSVLQASEVFRRLNSGQAVSYADYYPQLKPGQLMGQEIPRDFAEDWRRASAEYFQSPGDRSGG